MTQGAKPKFEMIDHKFKPVEEQLAYIKKGVAEIIPEPELVAKLENSRKTGKPLRVYLGVDPTAPDLHLGHTVVLRKLKHFQDLGHTAVFLIGDFSAMIGDPTGVSETRPPLTREQVDANAKTYLEQVYKILDREKTEVHYNSEWLDKLSSYEIVQLCGKYTVPRMLEREDFKTRLASGRAYEQQLRNAQDNQNVESNPWTSSVARSASISKAQTISIHELLYPLLTAYDAVSLKSDVELGATEQKFNLLVHRDIQREYGLPGQAVLTMPILVGLDGQRKMSKSLNNYIGITEPPSEMFGKIMSISDEMMWDYYDLLTDLDTETISSMKDRAVSGASNPMNFKMLLAQTIVRDFHSDEAQRGATENFQRVFRNRQVPQELRQIKIKRAYDGTFEVYELEDTDGRLISRGEFPLLGKEKWSKIMVAIKEIGSVSEAERLMKGGGLEVNKQVINDPTSKVNLGQYGEFVGEYVIRMGKKKYFRLVID